MLFISFTHSVFYPPHKKFQFFRNIMLLSANACSLDQYEMLWHGKKFNHSDNI